MEDSNVRELGLDSIRIDAALQPRVMVDTAVVTEYAEAMEAGDAFPAIVVFYDGTCFWLADGWHRVWAARSVRDKRTLLAEVREGTRRDALLYSLGANAAHGLRRTNADKRKAVERVLGDPEWATWSDREISRVCRVSPTFVGSTRKIVTVHVDSERTYTTKHGTVATMDTAPIAAANEARAAAPESVHTESKDGGVDGWTPEYGQDSESYAPIWRLEQAVNKYLDVRHGIRAAADENYAARLATVESLVNIHWDLVCREINQFIEQKWRKNDLLQALRNVRDQLRQQIARKQRGEGPPQGEPATEVVPAATLPREPSAWAPELKPRAQELGPDTQKLPENATIVEVATRVAVLADEVIKRGMWPGTYKPAMDLAEASRVLATMVLEMAYGKGALPEHPAVTEAMSAATQRGPIAVGAAVIWGNKTGTLIAWKANNRTAEVQDDSGRRYTMPAFMVQAIEAEPA